MSQLEPSLHGLLPVQGVSPAGGGQGSAAAAAAARPPPLLLRERGGHRRIRGVLAGGAEGRHWQLQLREHRLRERRESAECRLRRPPAEPAVDRCEEIYQNGVA